MRLFGYLVFLNTLVVCAYCILSTDIPRLRITALAGLGAVIGILFINAEDITSLKITWLGEIKTARNKAIAGAKDIEALHDKVMAQDQVVQLVVTQANSAAKNLEEIQQLSESARKSVVTLQETADFNMLVTRMSNDDRAAFDDLRRIARNSSSKFRDLADQSLSALITRSNVLSTGPGVDALTNLPAGFDFKVATLAQYRDALSRGLPSGGVEWVLSVFWDQTRIPQHDRIDLLVDQLETTPSVDVLMMCCRQVSQLTGRSFSPLRWEECVKWWKQGGRT